MTGCAVSWRHTALSGFVRLSPSYCIEMDLNWKDIHFGSCALSAAVCAVIIGEHMEPFSEPLPTHEIQMSRVSCCFFYCQIKGRSHVVSGTPPTTHLLPQSFVSAWIIISFFKSLWFVSFHCAAQMSGFLWIFWRCCVSKQWRRLYFDQSSEQKVLVATVTLEFELGKLE